MTVNDHHFMSDRPEWIMHYYPSVRAAVEAAEAPSGWIRGSSVATDYHSDWSGVRDFRTARDMAINGWSDSRPKVDAILAPVRERLAELLEYSQEPSYDVMGFEPDIDRYLDNEIECMREYMPMEMPTKGKVFNIVINGCYSGGVAPATVFAKGAAISALVEAFQILGFDMNIYVEVTTGVSGWGSGWNGKGQEYELWTGLTKVHTAGDNLDINNVMFPIGNPGWLRRISFAQMEHENLSVRKQFSFHAGGGYGHVEPLQCDEMCEASFTMSLSDSRSQDVTDPVEWVLAQLEAQGVWNRDHD